MFRIVINRHKINTFLLNNNHKEKKGKISNNFTISVAEKLNILIILKYPLEYNLLIITICRFH
jgi:hypothetical protein